MFQQLAQSFIKIFDRLKNNGVISEDQINATLRDIRIALLEADVALPVVKDFINLIKEKAKGKDLIKSVIPANMIIKITKDTMVNILTSSSYDSKLHISSKAVNKILIVGLQGSGKTTNSAKLALKFSKQNKRVLLVSLDTYRPAAQDQLKKLAYSIQVDSLDIVKNQKPIEIVRRSEQIACGYDIVIYDTAGMLHTDNDMINEVLAIKNFTTPAEILLVIDSLIGQDAITVANIFNYKLDITGIILSRVDGDARGGSALSIKHATGKPIKFLSVGEKLSDLEDFSAELIASRILGMGDIISLVEKASEIISHKESLEIINKKKFDLNDYFTQLKNIKKFGGINSIIKFLPNSNKMINQLQKTQLDNKLLFYQEAIILSMTNKEKSKPEILNYSRKKRIALGSGTSIQQVNTLLKQYKQLASLMKQVNKISFKNSISNNIKKLFS